MPSKPKQTPTPDGEGSLQEQLAALRGKSASLDVLQLDPVMFFYAATGLAKSGASIQIGLTRDLNSWSVQYWDGKFPIKEYYGDTDELNRALAAIARLKWQRTLAPEIEERIRAYGW